MVEVATKSTEISERNLELFQHLENIAVEDKDLRREIVEEIATLNQGFVVKKAKRYMDSAKTVGLPLDDLIQEGNMGLMKAIEKFDVSRGYRFSTYANRWVSQFIVRAIKRAKEGIFLISFQDPIADDEDLLLEDIIPDGSIDVEKESLINVRVQDVTTFINSMCVLSDRQKEIFFRRNYFDETLEEIGKSLGISKEGVRISAERASVKIKRAFVNLDL